MRFDQQEEDEELPPSAVTAQGDLDFYGTRLHIFRDEERRYWTALRPLCEAIGLDERTQFKKVMNSPQINCGHMPAVGEDGKNREMFCIPLDQVNYWLSTINPNKIDPSAREMFLLYQRECQQVLFYHFMPSMGLDEQDLVNTMRGVRKDMPDSETAVIRRAAEWRIRNGQTDAVLRRADRTIAAYEDRQKEFQPTMSEYQKRQAAKKGRA